MFAITCLFNINDVTAVVTLPQNRERGVDDAATSVEYYDRLMEDEASANQVVQRMQFCGDRWEVEKKPLNVKYISELQDSEDEPELAGSGDTR